MFETTRWLSNDMMTGTGQNARQGGRRLLLLFADNAHYVKQMPEQPGPPPPGQLT
jgi:hypothetical protein